MHLPVQSISHVFALCGNAASAVACIWLLWKLKRTIKPLRQLLFAQQMMSLTVVELLLHIASMVVALDSGGPRWIVESQPWACTAVSATVSSLRLILVLHVMYIAISISHYKSSTRRRHQRVFRHILRLAWILGIVIGVVAETVVNEWNWNSMPLLCLPQKTDWTSIIALATCGMACFVSYVVMVWRAFCVESAGDVQRRYFRRASFYPLIFIITYAPTLIYYVSSQRREPQELLFGIATLFESVNGLMNVTTYAWQAHDIAAQKKMGNTNSSHGARSSNLMMNAENISGAPPLTNEVAENESGAGDAACACEIA